MPDTVTVRVPATSANLGPGFDCLGLALELASEVTVSLEDGKQDSHPLASMVATAVQAAHASAGRPKPAELHVTWEHSLPIARGLGASAAARAAGLVAANALLDDPLSTGQLFEIGASLEGHPDNMAPAIFGGLQVAFRDGESWQRLGVPLPDGIKVVLFVPEFTMPTQESRRKMPKQLPREDAVFNVSRATLLVAALSQARWDLLDAATQDRLHQPARAEGFSALYDIFDAAKEAGAHAAYLSGGGSTVAALATQGEERIARLMQQAAVARGFGGHTIITRPSASGATVISA